MEKRELYRRIRRLIGLLVAVMIVAMMACSAAEGSKTDSATGYKVQIQVIPESTSNEELIEIDDYSVPLSYAEKDDNAFGQRHIVMLSVIGGLAVVYVALLMRERKEVLRLRSDLQAKEVQ